MMKTSQTLFRWLTVHDLWFAFFSILSLLPFWMSLKALVSLSLRDDRYSHVLLIPIISAGLVYLQRKRVFTRPQYNASTSVPVLTIGILLFGFAQTRLSAPTSNYHLSAVVLAITLVWMAGFILCYGTRSFRAALFPCLFLLLMIPIPTLALDKIVLVLQEASAITTYAIFTLLRVPILWQHFRFSLPGVEIEIAEECSGIRSSLALFITSILAGHVFLQSNWRKAIFSLLTIPIVIFKNAVRIVTISCLGVYVDPGFLHGRLHRYGGLPFSLVSLGILLPLLFALQKGESDRSEVTRANAEAGTHQGNESTPLSPHTETV
jgi:exosortase